jgi:hypothetical protein
MNLRDRYMLDEEREDDARIHPDEPHTWSESWVFIVSMLVISLAVYVARAWGWLP